VGRDMIQSSVAAVSVLLAFSKAPLAQKTYGLEAGSESCRTKAIPVSGIRLTFSVLHGMPRVNP